MAGVGRAVMYSIKPKERHASKRALVFGATGEIGGRIASGSAASRISYATIISSRSVGPSLWKANKGRSRLNRQEER